MEVIVAGVAYALSNTLPSNVLVKLGLASLLVSNPNFLAGLKPQLSPGASLVLPGDASFVNLTTHWREWHAPTIAAVVEVATEGDVQQAVRTHGAPKNC
jgi:hypothetical protein